MVLSWLFSWMGLGLVGCGSADSHVTVSPQQVTVSDAPGFSSTPTAVEIPNLISEKRTAFQSQSILSLSLASDLGPERTVTRIYNMTTQRELKEPDGFGDSFFGIVGLSRHLALLLPLGAYAYRGMFAYGPNLIRLDFLPESETELPFTKHAIEIQDFTVGAPSLNTKSLLKRSAGQVDMMTSPVQVSAGGSVLSSNLLMTVFE